MNKASFSIFVLVGLFHLSAIANVKSPGRYIDSRDSRVTVKEVYAGGTVVISELNGTPVRHAISGDGLVPEVDDYRGIKRDSVVLSREGFQLTVTEVYADGRFAFKGSIWNGRLHPSESSTVYKGKLADLPVRISAETVETTTIFLDAESRRVHILELFSSDVSLVRTGGPTDTSGSHFYEKTSKLVPQVSDYNGIRSGDSVVSGDGKRIVVNEIFADGRFTYDIQLPTIASSRNVLYIRNAVFDGTLADVTVQIKSCESLFSPTTK